MESQLTTKRACAAALPAGAVLAAPRGPVCWRRAACAARPAQRQPSAPHLQRTASVAVAALPDNLLESLDMPDIDADLATYQEEMGATFGPDGVPDSFGNEEEAFAALESGAVLVDRSNAGRLRVGGEDRLAFLHGQSTNDLQALQPGQGCDTVFVTAQARTLDLATCLVQGSGVLLLVSPGMKQGILQRLDKYIFPGDKVELADVSSRTCQFCLLGPKAGEVLGALGVDAAALAQRGHGAHTLLGLGGRPVVVAVGGGLVPGAGFTLVVDEACAGELWNALAAKGAVPMGSEAWEAARVVAGRPAPGAELTDDFNPLEAGLYHAVSVSKGCYIGQETISKVHNLGAVKQQLWGLELEGPCSPGDAVQSGGTPLGKLTSVAQLPSGAHHGLAYLKSKVKGEPVELSEGTVLEVVLAGSRCGGLGSALSAVRGRLVAPPALSREFQGAAAESGGESEAEQAARQEKEAAEAAAAAAREEKLRAMQERLAAWQAQQQQQGGGGGGGEE